MHTHSSDSFLSLLGLAHAGPALRQRALAEAIAVIERRALIAALDQLSVDEQEIFLDLLEKGTDEEKNIFMRQHLPNISRLVADEVTALRQRTAQIATAA